MRNVGLGTPRRRAPLVLAATLTAGMCSAAAGGLAGSSAWAAGASASAPLASHVPNLPATGAAPAPNGQGNGSGRGGTTSQNWAGYVDTGTTFSSVAGAWTEPTATCQQNQTQQAAFWVGIGGFAQGDPDIEQIGTDSDCTKGKGKHPGGPSYYAWYQMFPQSLVVLPDAVSPGDTIEASVTVTSPNRYQLSIVDVGHWSFSTTQSQASQPADASAEWITEAPSACAKGRCKVLPLADFGSVSYSSASTNGEAISGSGLTDTEITLTNKNGKIVKARPSSLTSGGTSFSVTWASH